MNQLKGDDLPVSIFQKYHTVDGIWPSGTSKYDKRTDAVLLPKWDASKCIQCNQCSLVCPHAAIRAVLLDETEKAAAACRLRDDSREGTRTREIRLPHPGISV